MSELDAYVPLTNDEEAGLRASVESLGTPGDLRWTNEAMRRVLATLDAADTDALRDITKERARQDAKWGEQNHDATVWLAVLTEEVGELADAILVRRAMLADGYNLGPAVEAMRHEAVQVAAVAVAFIEWMDRGATGEGATDE